MGIMCALLRESERQLAVERVIARRGIEKFKIVTQAFLLRLPPKVGELRVLE